jgi:hypothetical protein
VAAGRVRPARRGRAVHRRERPQIVGELRADGGRFAAFAGVGNTDGVNLLLDLGVAVGAVHRGRGLFRVAKNASPSVAAWRASHDAAPADRARIADRHARWQGRTPLMLAVRACVDSCWTRRRSPESVKALLDAGASVQGVPFRPAMMRSRDQTVRWLTPPFAIADHAASPRIHEKIATETLRHRGFQTTGGCLFRTGARPAMEHLSAAE